MATNTLLNSTIITRESLRVLHQKLNFVGAVTRDYDDRFAKDGARNGDTVKVRLPNEYTVGSGDTITPQDTVESSVDLKVDTLKHVGMEFGSTELTLSLDDFSERIIEPAMARLAAAIEADCLLKAYRATYNQVNNQGAAASFAKFLQARKMLVDNLAPPDGRAVVLNTQDNVDMVDALKGLFNDQASIGKQYREGVLGKTAGFEFSENTLLPSHTRGAGAGYLINGAGQSGATLTVDTGSGAISEGDVFTIAGVYRVHPETKLSTGVLQQFVVTADASSGATSLSISPAIVTSGAKQNVNAAPADNAAITFAGTASTAHGVSLAFQKSAFAFVTADQFLPKGTDFAGRAVQDGISLRILRDFDVTTNKLVTRCDVLYGFKALRPQLAARVANN